MRTIYSVQAGKHRTSLFGQRSSELAISMAIFDHFQLIKNIQITEEEGCFPFKSDRFYSFLSLWTNIPIDRPTNHTILKKYIFLFLLLVI